MIQAVVAYNDNFVIGDKQGKIPWQIAEEMAHFKETTMGHVVIMGRKTWESIPARFRPLRGRTNIVLTRTPAAHLFEAHTATSLPSAIALGRELQPDREIFVIGGEEVYRRAIEEGLIERVVASKVHGYLDAEAGAFFPDLKIRGWRERVLETHPLFDVYEYLAR